MMLNLSFNFQFHSITTLSSYSKCNINKTKESIAFLGCDLNADLPFISYARNSKSYGFLNQEEVLFNRWGNGNTRSFRELKLRHTRFFTLSKANYSSGGGDGNKDLRKLSIPAHKWRMIIAYDGTRFAGWQYQLSPPTIQCIVEKALTQITKLERTDLCLVGASRTDTGVHACGQVAHFVTPFNYESLESMHAALNGLLPPDIRVREISPAIPEFHARFSAKSKIYHYKIYNDTIMDPFQHQWAYHSVYKLNANVMREAAKQFIGKHDFSAFVNASRNDRSPDPVKNICRFDVNEMGPLLQLEVEGSGFLYRQVRNMVALLLQIGREAIPPDIVAKILATRDRKELAKFALSVPPHGLCLVSVHYNNEHLRLPKGCPATSFGRHRSIRKCKLPIF